MVRSGQVSVEERLSALRGLALEAELLCGQEDDLVLADAALGGDGRAVSEDEPSHLLGVGATLLLEVGLVLGLVPVRADEGAAPCGGGLALAWEATNVAVGVEDAACYPHATALDGSDESGQAGCGLVVSLLLVSEFPHVVGQHTHTAGCGRRCELDPAGLDCTSVVTLDRQAAGLLHVRHRALDVAVDGVPGLGLRRGPSLLDGCRTGAVEVESLALASEYCDETHQEGLHYCCVLPCCVHFQSLFHLCLVGQSYDTIVVHIPKWENRGSIYPYTMQGVRNQGIPQDHTARA